MLRTPSTVLDSSYRSFTRETTAAVERLIFVGVPAGAADFVVLSDLRMLPAPAPYEFRHGERELVQNVIQQEMNTMSKGSTALDVNATVLAFDNERVDMESYFTEHTTRRTLRGRRSSPIPSGSCSTDSRARRIAASASSSRTPSRRRRDR